MLFLKILGSIGHPLQHTEIKVVDADTQEVLAPGSKGIVKVRGPQVMRGYYKVSLSCRYSHAVMAGMPVLCVITLAVYNLGCILISAC